MRRFIPHAMTTRLPQMQAMVIPNAPCPTCGGQPVKHVAVSRYPQTKTTKSRKK